MSDDLVEKVARALCCDAEGRDDAWDRAPMDLRNAWLCSARAALRVVREALAEPDTNMLQDGNRAHRRTQRAGVSGMTLDAQIRAECSREDACWRAMLAASPLGRVS